MPTKLSKYFSNCRKLPTDYLPLVHTMDWKQFVETIEGSSVLKAPKCDVFDPDYLIYLFYGRPCYKMHMGQNATSNPSMDTVCILFDPESLPNPKRIYPFDSGAFHEGFFDDYLHPTDIKEQFEIKPELKSAKKIVGRCFGDNLSYFKEKLKKNLNPSLTQLEAITYFQLVNAKNQTQFDSRKSAIEFQIEGDINLLSTNVLAVIANEDVFDEPKIADYISNVLGAEKIGYYSPHSKSEEEALLVMNKTKEFCEKSGLFT